MKSVCVLHQNRLKAWYSVEITWCKQANLQVGRFYYLSSHDMVKQQDYFRLNLILKVSWLQLYNAESDLIILATWEQADIICSMVPYKPVYPPTINKELTVLEIDTKAVGWPIITWTEVLDYFGKWHSFMLYLLKDIAENNLEWEIASAVSLLQRSLRRWAMTIFFCEGKTI